MSFATDFKLFQLIICSKDGYCTDEGCTWLHPHGQKLHKKSLPSNQDIIESLSSLKLSGVSESKYGEEKSLPRQERVEYDIAQLPVIGKGSYGKVMKAVDSKNPKKSVAIKVIKSKFLKERTHYCLCIFREMYTLRHLNHPNVVKLLDVRAPKYTTLNKDPSTLNGREFEQLDELHLVFESADCDLHQYTCGRRRSHNPLTQTEIKSLMYQLLVAVRYIHSAHIIHRDIKPDNLLIWETELEGSKNLELKLSDFGLSRIVHEIDADLHDTPSPSSPSAATSPADADNDTMQPPKLSRDLTKHVVTRWYRAPEVILVQKYGPAVDMWSVGCVLAYLLGNGAPFFPGAPVAPLSIDFGAGEEGSVEDNQLNVIFRVIGGPTAEDMAMVRGCAEMELYLKTFQHIRAEEPLSDRLPAAPPEAIDLLQKLIHFNPNTRISVEEALAHPFLASVRDSAREQTEASGLTSPEIIEHPPAHSQLKKNVLTKIAEEVMFYNTR